MTDLVLVPGAQLRARAWDEAQPHPAPARRAVPPATLSGLAQKRDLPCAEISQVSHVADILAAVEHQGVRDVVLVGHSYAGIPVGQAAARLQERIVRVVYVDANIPHDGQSMISAWSE